MTSLVKKSPDFWASTRIFERAYLKHDLELLETFLQQKDDFNTCFLRKMEIRGKKITGSIRFLYEAVNKPEFFARLARDVRFEKHLKSIGLFRYAVRQNVWPVIRILLQRQSTFELFLKAAYYQVTYPYPIYFEHFISLSNVPFNAWREKRKRREIFKLVNQDAFRICIGLAQLDLPCMLLTSLVEKVCQPWSNTVHQFDVWTCCSFILHYKLRLKDQTKSELAIARKRVFDLEQQYKFLESWIGKTHKIS